MDKTHHISLGGFSFLIEEKAYQELSSYLHSVRASLKNNPDTEEIIYDVEQRMAELLPTKMAGRQVIISSDVDFLIAKLGRPEQYIDEDFSTENTASASEENTEKKLFRSQKLYRDMENKKLGGVLAGLSHYLGFEVVWLRIIFVLSIFAFGSGIVLYIVLWVIVPPAMTTAEKLEMKGKSVNINTISSFKDEANALASKLYRSRRNRLLGGVLGGISDMMAWEVTWVRIVFILLFLGFVPFVTQISGYMTTLYILIWIAVPSEKRNYIFDENSSEETSETSQNQQEITENIPQNSWNFFRAIFKGLAYIAIGFGAFILLIIAVSLLLSFVGIGVGFWGISFVTLTLTDYLPYIIDGNWQLWLGYASGILLLIFPISLICILALKLFSKKGYTAPRAWVLANVFCFFFGIVGLTIVATDTIKALKAKNYTEEKISLPSSDILSLSYEIQPVNRNFHTISFVDIDNFEVENNILVKEDNSVRFYIRKTNEKDPFIIIRKFSHGRTLSQAKENAENIAYKLLISENNIALPHQYQLGTKPKMRLQNVKVYLYLPEGKSITSPSEELSVWEESTNKWINISRGSISTMKQNGLE